MTEHTQDGFDAIEYPLDYSFKAVCDKSVGEGEPLELVLKKAVATVVGENKVKKVAEKESRTGRYVSMTIVVHLTCREHLEGIYSALSQCDAVRMTL